MNPFVFACITPHGSEIIEVLSPNNPALMQQTRHSMETLGNYMADAKPDTIIVLTPHGLRIDGAFSIADCERMYGELEDEGAKVTMERLVNRGLAKSIATTAEQMGLRVGRVNFATASGPFSCIPLDWGVIVPLYFMPETRVVVITPSRFLSYEDHVKMGQAVAQAVQTSGERVAMIASCDWSHAHDENGPYGYHSAAANLDAEVVQLLKSNDIEAMMGFDPVYVEDAKPDGIWQALILAGAIPKRDRHVEFLSYEVPTYFGLMCAAYHQHSYIA